MLVLLPGPNVALIVANSLSFGRRLGLVTVLGTTLGVALQLARVVFGIAAIIEMAANALAWIKCAGVIYLIWLGIRTWNEKAADLGNMHATPTVFWRACAIAAVNPSSARRFLERVSVWRKRLTGGFLVAAVIGLALSRHNI